MIDTLPLSGLLLVQPKRYIDPRGYFSETYVQSIFKEAGINTRFVQDNESRSYGRGIVRGLHFQAPPAAQAKLVRCVIGEILDVVVDIRTSSPTYGQHVSQRLSADAGEQLFIPAGFAHGFCTLSDDTLIQYKVDNFYAPETEGGIFWAILNSI